MQRSRVGDDGAERLAKIDALSELAIGQRRQLARLVDQVSAAAGETLVAQGEPGYEFLMLEEGTADVIQDGQVINTVGPGDFFGELAVLDSGVPRSASVVATSDLRVIVLTAHFMREMRERMPSVGANIDRVAVERRERDANDRR